ncbi:MAG: alpha/beta fold hydrolase [Deltaproteobacteria bacterium]|nr:alpha/beta fold hydrolase [Deltaproteobacteria bacterium]
MTADPGRARRRWENLLGLPRRGRPGVGATPADAVLRENKYTLWRYRPGPEGVRFETPVLLVPSLINRHYVLDLQPGRSFAEYLVSRGHEVFILDWGTPGPEDRHLTFDDVCDGYLGRAVRWCAKGAPRGKAHLLGYCLGGTLAAVHAAARPERVASLVALAAPVRFDDTGLLSRWSRVPTVDLGALVEALGNVPWQLMQSAFHMLRPTLSLSKAAQLLDRAWDDEFLDGFLALETWGNDNVSFPGAAFRQYIQHLYREDALVKGTLTLGGRPARLEGIRCPTLAITFEHDTIVPVSSAAALLDHLTVPDRERIHLSGGHVGAVVSRKAAQTLWPRVSAWWAARDRETPEAPPAPPEDPRPVKAPRRKRAPSR